VLNDFSFLPTLADRDWIGGTAEAFKVAIIRDAEFFDWLAARAASVPARDQAVMETLIRRCATLHLEHIRTSGDPFEFGSARPLDFGHWAAHKIEMMTDCQMSHGQAVALGMAVDCCYAASHGWLAQADLLRVLTALEACGLPTWDECLCARDGDGELLLLDGLRQFRENLGGRLNVTMPDGIGNKREIHDLAADGIEQALTFLRRRHEANRP
jgi:3-dehydroquinate synthase